jgi:hypothetical protein
LRHCCQQRLRIGMTRRAQHIARAALTDWTHTTTHIVVALGTTDQTNWTIEPGQPSYAFYCQGPLQTTGPPTPATPFKWASTGAATQPPGAGQCAWGDRGPEARESGAALPKGELIYSPPLR